MTLFKDKIYKVLVLFVLFLSILFSSYPSVSAQSSQDQLSDIQKKLDDLLKKRDALNAQIKQEQNNQLTLAQQAKNLDRQIAKNEIQVQALELELQKIQLEVQILKEEQNKLQTRLDEIQGKLQKTEEELKSSMNLLYKLSLSNNTILDKNTDFQQSIINEEKERATLRIIKASINEIKDLQAEVLAKKTEIDEKEKQASELQAQKEAQSNNLAMQQNALKWQKANKENLLTQSKQNQENLDAKVREASTQIAKIEAERAAIMNSLANLPATGSYVSAGQVIGFQGRSGLSCDPYDPALEPKRTNDYCDVYGATTPKGYWYYYDPARFPTKGSHLHFEYRKGGKVVNPYNMLFDSSNNEFQSMPLNPMYFSRGLHYNGVDLVSYHGAPVYSVKPGFVSYYCINYPPVPGFPDPLFLAIVHHVDSKGKLDGSSSSYLHLQRRGAACTYAK